jgi:hypothetical protein
MNRVLCIEPATRRTSRINLGEFAFQLLTPLRVSGGDLGQFTFSIPLSGPCKPTCLGYMLEPFLPGGGLRETPPFEVARAGFRLASRLNCIQLAFRSARADFMRAINPIVCSLAPGSKRNVT